jgi:hypothetical protein
MVRTRKAANSLRDLVTNWADTMWIFASTRRSPFWIEFQIPVVVTTNLNARIALNVFRNRCSAIWRTTVRTERTSTAVVSSSHTTYISRNYFFYFLLLFSAKVTVIQPPPANVNLTRGETFTITCRTFGVPTPEVIWRWNWGHVPSNCKSTSNDGNGVLTCINVQVGSRFHLFWRLQSYSLRFYNFPQPENSGAYSCEAINNRGPVFAPVDTILTVPSASSPGSLQLCARGLFGTISGKCVDCYCSGVSNDCSSANLYVSRVSIAALWSRLSWMLSGIVGLIKLHRVFCSYSCLRSSPNCALSMCISIEAVEIE